MVKKSVHEINKKIEDGSVNVVTAEEMVTVVEELGAEGAAKEVDVVTTGTFGAMCSSGLMLNLGHSEPPIKIQKIWFNNVEAYSGLAAVDAYLGAAQISDTREFSMVELMLLKTFSEVKRSMFMRLRMGRTVIQGKCSIR